LQGSIAAVNPSARECDLTAVPVILIMSSLDEKEFPIFLVKQQRDQNSSRLFFISSNTGKRGTAFYSS
jgi:hypothetical protein